MKTRIRLTACWLLTTALTLVVSTASAQPQGQSIPVLPEASLAKWYRPVNERQVWLHTMFSLRRELQAVEHYAAREDQVLLTKWTERLAGHYRKIGDMVPEWQDELEPDTLADLEAAVAAGDFTAVSQATRRLSHNCKGCHSDYRALTAARFRSPDFSAVRIDDGTGGSRDHGEHMELLSMTLNEIKIASEDGRWEAALNAEARLLHLLDLLGKSCAGCHGQDPIPAERILGSATRPSLGALHDALETKSARNTGRYLGEAAVNICARCHSVHRTLYDLSASLFR